MEENYSESYSEESDEYSPDEYAFPLGIDSDTLVNAEQQPYTDYYHPEDILDLGPGLSNLNPIDLLYILSAELNNNLQTINIFIEQTPQENVRTENVELCIRYSRYNEIEKSRQENQPECSICMEKFEEDSIVSDLDCKHIFHQECIQEWGKWQQCCPYCKANLAYNYTNQEENEIPNSAGN